MASFLSGKNVSFIDGSQTGQILGGATSFGPPRVPSANFAVIPGGVSLLPNTPAVPGGAGPVALQPYQRVPARSLVRLEKNPRIALAYTIQTSQEQESQPTQGDLVVLKKAEGWDVPTLMNIQDYMQNACDTIESHEDFEKYFFENRFVGVYNMVIDTKNQSYGTDTVTINAARFCSVRDYWGTQVRAGDHLYFVAMHGRPGSEEPSRKRSNTNPITFFFMKACTPKKAFDKAKKSLGVDTGHGVAVRIGRAQNHIIPVFGEQTVTQYLDFDEYNQKGHVSSRLREIHLDHLFVPHFFDE